MKRVGTISGLRIKRDRESARESIESGRFLANLGLEGDFHTGGKVQVVALPGATRDAIDRSGEPGLCFERFRETVTMAFTEYTPAVGDRLKVGEAVFEIVKVGKRCFPECELIRGGTRCALATDAFHCDVVEGGILRIGDPIWRI